MLSVRRPASALRSVYSLSPQRSPTSALIFSPDSPVFARESTGESDQYFRTRARAGANDADRRATVKNAAAGEFNALHEDVDDVLCLSFNAMMLSSCLQLCDYVFSLSSFFLPFCL